MRGNLRASVLLQAGITNINALTPVTSMKFYIAYGIVDAWQSKIQSISLCSVDATFSSLLASSLSSEEGVYET
jgi:hypothetical protein